MCLFDTIMRNQLPVEGLNCSNLIFALQPPSPFWCITPSMLHYL